ncbi:MAG: hypothetical protein A2X36_04330 [Elusimicrobia bacterium GWA2_69_24]|nr:MAG: hypothetical protein A2X36_04330 [Elusimicrobia bacterium GWA2_69_24]
MRTLEAMPVFWNWEMVLACNFRCSYCNYTCLGWERHHAMNVFPGLARLSEVWSRIQDLYGTVHIELSGGECTSYPGWEGVINMLVGIHTVSLDTNLSLDAERFAKLVKLERVRISASFHPQFSDFDSFLRKCLTLKERRVSDLFINYVAYPDQLAEMARYKKAFNEHGIRFYVQPFQGVYRKCSVYPESYTEAELGLIEEALALGGPDADISRGRFQWKGSAMRTGTEEQLRKIQEERGTHLAPPLVATTPKRPPVHCHMGHYYAKTYVNGDTYRCCAKPTKERPAELLSEKLYLGNLFLDDDLKLLEAPAACDYEPCPCDRCMVVGQETRWLDRWCAPDLTLSNDEGEHR